MAPETAVALLGEFIAARLEFTEDELRGAMADAGIPDPVADRAYQFTQIAWGRVFLDGLGLQFSSDYLCFNGAGDVIESGLLTAQPYFAAAIALAPKYARSPGFPKFALMSADVNAVNSALHAGSKPENLVMGPSALFMEVTTPSGIEKAQQYLSKHVASSTKASHSESVTETSATKPWWRFWS
ncbi:MAG TPA: hypothetical protein VGJ05_05955 [Fimbriiglobus sp.]|jgi:hypothetical protein